MTNSALFLFPLTGVELINKKSFLFKHIHAYDDEVEEISATLSLLATAARKTLGSCSSSGAHKSGLTSGNSSSTHSPTFSSNSEHVPGSSACIGPPRTPTAPPKPSIFIDGPQPLKTIFRIKAEAQQQAQAAAAASAAAALAATTTASATTSSSFVPPPIQVIPTRPTSVEPVVAPLVVSRPPPPPSLPPSQKGRSIKQYFKPLAHYVQREEEANQQQQAAAAAVAASGAAYQNSGGNYAVYSTSYAAHNSTSYQTLDLDRAKRYHRPEPSTVEVKYVDLSGGNGIEERREVVVLDPPETAAVEGMNFFMSMHFVLSSILFLRNTTATIFNIGIFCRDDC